MRLRIALALSLALVACEKKKEALKPAEPPELRTDATYLTPVQHLVRLSLDLRGTRPTIVEINEIEADPSDEKMRAFIRAWLEDPRFRERVKEIWNEGFLTRQDRPYFPGAPELRGFISEDEFAKASSNEPLELIAHVVMNDRPFTEVVTAEYTVANGVLATYYDITRENAAGHRWIESHYTDGRPEAGVLSSTAFHTRWTTTDSNANRGRANAWTRSVLCYDFMTRDIVIDTALDLSDPNVVNNAVRTNPSCVGCHQSLDPIASHFYGYFIPEDVSEEAERSYPIKTYSADLEARWEGSTGREPGYFGFKEESANLRTLGLQIAEDPRFSMCAVKRFTKGLTGIPLKEQDFEEADRLHDWFVKTNYDAKKLVEELLMSPQYRIAAPLAPTAENVLGLKLLSPEQVNRMLVDLTAEEFAWVMDFPEGYHLLENDIYGFRMMSGGYDSRFVTAPAFTVNATHILTLRMAAADAASRAVERELPLEPGQRRLLTRVTAITDTSEATVRAQAVDLYKMLYGEVITPESQDATDVWTLFSTVNARSGDPAYAWKITLAALFSDLRIAFY